MTAVLSTTRRASPGVIAAVLAILWLLVGPRTPDLAAAVYRASLFAREGLQLYDVSWFDGHYLPSYSLVAPALGAVLGSRVSGALAAVVSAILFERIATRWWGPRAARPAAVWFAVATVTDLLIGRITFGVGIAVGLGALLALQHGRGRTAAGLAVLCSATSPVAGAFLALAATAVWLADRERRAALWTAACALGAVAVLTTAFPEGGVQPFSLSGLVAILGASAAIIALADPRDRALRIGAALYAAAGTLCFLVPTAMGSNVSRLGAEFAGPLLLGSLLARRRDVRMLPVLGIAALLTFAAWQWVAPVRETVRGVGDPSYAAHYYRPLIRFLRHDAPGPVRVEVPFTTAHWEAVHLAPRFPLARGWETQLDRRYNPLFFHHTLSPVAYRQWLEHNAVSYVAVPDAPLDPSGRAEARLVRGGLPFLQRVWGNHHWDLYRVRDPQPMVSGPAQLRVIDVNRFVLRAQRRGSALVRVHWTPYWVIKGGGCTAKAGPWTRVQLARPGRVAVEARFSLDAVVAGDRACVPGKSRPAP